MLIVFNVIVCFLGPLYIYSYLVSTLLTMWFIAALLLNHNPHMLRFFPHPLASAASWCVRGSWKKNSRLAAFPSALVNTVCDMSQGGTWLWEVSRLLCECFATWESFTHVCFLKSSFMQYYGNHSKRKVNKIIQKLEWTPTVSPRWEPSGVSNL